MKIKSLTKLAMSGVALAAVAATLGTSTYAWYVINPVANVTNIEASTEANGSTSILVSKDGSNFSGKVAFGDNDFISGNKPGNVRNNFVPVTTATGRTFYDMDNYKKVLASDSTATTSSAYLKFSVWVKAGATGNIDVQLSAVNKDASSLPTQYAYQDVSTTKTATSSFTVDAMQALRTAVVVDDSTNVTTVYDTLKIAYTSDYNASNKYAKSIPGDINDTTKIKDGTAQISDGAGGLTTSSKLSGAHLYFAQVMAEAPVTTADVATVSEADEITDVTIETANVAVKLTFYIWLEGGDDLCFDACGGQDFEFGLQFKASA